jgi:hypothetical protein
VQRDVPFKLVVSAAICVILGELPIAGEYPCVIFAEQVELIEVRVGPSYYIDIYGKEVQLLGFSEPISPFLSLEMSL